jgi:hypothetical protein
MNYGGCLTADHFMPLAMVSSERSVLIERIPGYFMLVG